MYLGISRAVHKGRVGDVSSAVQTHAEAAGYGIVTNFVGHGVGQSLHEEPQIPNFGKSGSGPKFKKGMTVCIEPMVNMGTWKDTHWPDGWTAVTKDGLPSAQFEHTLLVNDTGVEILGDHQACEVIFAHGGSQRAEENDDLLITERLIEILTLANHVGCEVTFRWVRRDLIQDADDLSKDIGRMDFSLAPHLLATLRAHWGPWDIDRFAHDHGPKACFVKS